MAWRQIQTRLYDIVERASAGQSSRSGDLLSESPGMLFTIARYGLPRGLGAHKQVVRYFQVFCAATQQRHRNVKIIIIVFPWDGRAAYGAKAGLPIMIWFTPCFDKLTAAQPDKIIITYNCYRNPGSPGTTPTYRAMANEHILD